MWSEKGSLAEGMRPRLYHSISILLPDCKARARPGPAATAAHPLAAAAAAPLPAHPLYPAQLSCGHTHTTWMPASPCRRVLPPFALQVMLAGSDVTNDQTAEIYSPPYLSKGPQPVITDAPSFVPAGSEATVAYTSASPVIRALLIRNGATTHSMNFGAQRHGGCGGDRRAVRCGCGGCPAGAAWRQLAHGRCAAVTPLR